MWTEATDGVRSYANGIRTHAGGTHEAGLWLGGGSGARSQTHKVPIKGVTITAEDIQLVAVCRSLCDLSSRPNQDRLNN